MEKAQSIKIDLSHIEEGLLLYIDAKRIGDIEIDVNNLYEQEPKYQIKEGRFYDFEFSHSSSAEKYRLICSDQNNIIQNRQRKEYLGTIAPNIFVGTLNLQIFNIENFEKKWELQLEVQSIKTSYRQDYQYMLSDIASKCTDLIIQANSPVNHRFETDPQEDNETLYQRFAFISAMIKSEDFENAIHRIVTSPSTNWTEQTESVDARKIKRYRNKELRLLLNSENRFKLNSAHPLYQGGIKSIATKVDSYRKVESFDTAENRFIKHALETFLKFCLDISNHPNAGARLKKEAAVVSENLETHLQHNFFRDISRPTTLKLNSPTLQKKEGYREILNVWLKYDLAAQLIWEGGDQVYEGGNKDIATLYEYWLFFKLLNVLNQIFEIEPKELQKLIVPSKDKLGLQLIQGKVTALSGTYTQGSRDLNIRFNYNRSFKGGTRNVLKSGSWTTTLRPDYTLSIWPTDINEPKAEATDQIVHIHFDAKYKIANINQILEEDKNEARLNEEKDLNLKGIYKNIDLLKMHAYKDAIRRTSGAYVLYPGEVDKPIRGFHEILPGLGAFPIKPSENTNETIYLEKFLKEVLQHFLNRASQRENIASKTHEIIKGGKSQPLNEPLPEYISGKKLIPDETYVIIGYCKSKKHHDWYLENGLYNFRMNDSEGSLILDSNTVKAKYLLLRREGKAHEVYKILSKGPKVFSRATLISKGYPEPREQEYLIIKIEKEPTKELGITGWNYKELDGYKELEKIEKRPRILAGIPFTVSLTELMRKKAPMN